MNEKENMLIELKEATIVAHNVIAVAKMRQPATLQTPEVPYLQLILRDGQPLLVPFDTDEECNQAYLLVVETIRIC